MSDPRGHDRLGGDIATVLRVGTLAAIAAVGIGYALSLASGDDPGNQPLVALLQGGGASAVIGIGLFGLTLLPVLMLAVTAIGFGRLRERRLVLTTVGVIGLLLASLVAALILPGVG